MHMAKNGHNETVATEVEPKDGVEPASTEAAAEESEFKVTVRKLEMPVRPRGVLAE